MSHIIIVGAGVVGSSLAWQLSRAGQTVTLIESAFPGAGSSGLSFAWPNAQEKYPRAYHDLNVAGMKEHAKVVSEWDDARWNHPGGHFEWCVSPERQAWQKKKVEELLAWNYRAEWLDVRELKKLEPDVELGLPDDHPVVCYPDEGWIDPVVYMQAMIAAARRYGCKLVLARVTGLVIESGKVTGVKTADGATLGADLVVNCTGPELNGFIDDPALQVPMRSTPGLTVVTPPLPIGLTRILHPDDFAVRPDGAGRLLAHSLTIDKGVDPHTMVPRADLPAAVELVAKVNALFPNVGRFPAEAVRIGWRPIPGDGHPAIGPVPGLDGYYVVVTHSGVTLAAILGRVCSAEILTGTVDPLIADFRATRLFEGKRNG